MFVCLASLSEMIYVKCLCVLSPYLRCYLLNVCVSCNESVVSSSQMLYVKCLCVVVSLSQMLYVKCLCVLSRYLRCYMLNVCVCCPVISDVIC